MGAIAERKRLYRSRTDSQIAGVLGGISEYFGVGSSWVRVLYMMTTFFTMGVPGILLYVVMSLIVPRAPEESGPEREAQPE